MGGGRVMGGFDGDESVAVIVCSSYLRMGVLYVYNR